MSDKIIQVDVNKLKELFSNFHHNDNMRGLLSACSRLEQNLDEQKFFTLSERIQETRSMIDNVNETLLEIRKMLINGGCMLD